MKTCSTCKIEKPLTEFYNNRIREDGKHGQCIECFKKCLKPKSKEQADRDSKKYRDAHKEKVRASFKKWYQLNKEKVISKRNDNPKHAEKSKEWRGKNKDKINAQRRMRRKNMSPRQKAEKAVRDRFHKVIIRMKSGVKHESPLLLLGCSIDFFRNYIESQFSEGMNWSNHGNGDGKWNIDHIKPLVCFDLRSHEDQKEAFHYSNMRPLWFMENMKRPRKKFAA